MLPSKCGLHRPYHHYTFCQMKCQLMGWKYFSGATKEAPFGEKLFELRGESHLYNLSKNLHY